MKKVISLIITLTLVLALSACSKPEGKTLKVGVTPVPHGEIMEKAAELLEKENITLDIVEFTDYVLPNTALDSGDIDCNFFQHLPYLTDFNEKHGTDIVSVAPVHFEPLGVFKGNTDSIDSLPDGAVIAIPNDASNGARALLLLEDLGIITLKEDAGLTASVLDIKDNPKNIEFFEIEAAQLARTIEDVDLAVLNGNYARQAGIFDLLIAGEDKDGKAAQTYANLLCVKAGNEENEAVKKLCKVLQSDEMRKFIEEKYEGLFVSAF